MDSKDLLPVDIIGFAPAQQEGGFAVFLKERGENRCLPIVIGAAEAQAISIILNPVTVPRPMTHDTFKNILDALSAQVKRIVVTKLEDHTFYADIWIVSATGDNFHLDARPSDALAIALRNGAPMFVARAVMDAAGVKVPEEVEGRDEESPGKEPTQLQQLQRKLDRAVEKENYEAAARLRDEIRKLEEARKGEEEDDERRVD
jgi:bifunctional DNase/RNase